MEFTDVELGAELFLGSLPELLDLELAELVRQCLARPDDVAVDLDDDVMLGLADVLHELSDGLLPRPAEGMHAGVDHQPGGPPGLVRQQADAVEVGGVEAHLFGQALGVERPALAGA